MMLRILKLILIFLSTPLIAQEQPEIVITSGHIASVFSVDFSADNRYIVTAGMDKTVRIWDRSLRQEFRVLYGHTGDIWQACYTTDNKHIISMDDKGVLITWNHASGEIVQRNKVGLFIRQFTYIAGTNSVLIADDGKIKEVDIMTGAVVGIHGEIANPEILLIDKEHILYRSVNTINGLDIYNFKTKQIVATLVADHNQALFYLATSRDGKQIAAFSMNNQMFNVWNLESRKVISSFKYPNVNVAKMVFTPDNKELLVLERMATISIYTIKNSKLKTQMNAPSTTDVAEMQKGAYRIGTAWDMAISPDNSMVAVAEMLNESTGAGVVPSTFMGVILFDYNTNKELGRLKGYFKMSSHLSVSSNSKYLVNSLYNKQPGLRVWNMKEGDLERFIPTSGVAGASADGSVFGAWVVGKEEKAVLTVYDANTLAPILQSKEVDALSDIAFNNDGSKMLTQEVYVDLKNYLNNKYFFRVWDVQKQKIIGNRIEFGTTEIPIFKALRMSPDGNYIIAQINGSEITCWDIATGKRIASRPSQIGYEFILDFVPNSTKILISTTKPEYDLENRKMKADMEWVEWDYVKNESAAPYKTGHEGILFSGNFSSDGQYLVTGQGGYFNDVQFNVVIWDWAAKKRICEMPGHHGEIKFVWFGSDNKRVYSTAQDGFIKVWEMGNCQLAASMIAQEELDYIILSPDNFYKSSKGNNEGIGFRYNSNLYTFDQFDVRFNRPDKVLTSLGVSPYSVKLYTKAWEKRLDKMGFKPEDMEGELALPQIELSNKITLPVTTNEKKLKLNIKAWDEVHPLDRISVYVNDVPSPQLQGISLKAFKSKTVEKELDIDLSTGINWVKVSVFNEQGLESLRESFQINYAPETEKKPNLYIFAIGVSEFADKERNLKFATKDAGDLIKKFADSKYFGNIYSEQLFNTQATKENVAKAAKFLEKATTDDQILIYVSSHGLLDEKLDYYLAMHDVDFNNPAEKGLPYEAVNSMLDGVACRNRLIMIDACHSGELDKDESQTIASNTKIQVNAKSGNTLVRPKTGLNNSFTYMKTLFDDVSKGTGATVISAAGGYEFALESADWNNGVFTYSILQGLTSGEADLNGDGLVYVSELKDYVTLKVVELTDGKQHPTTRSENSLNDFVLFRVR